MPVNALRQYLEMLKNNGIKELYKPIDTDKTALLAELKAKYSSCDKCPLSQGRTNFVYGEGNPNAKAMIIGEAPGKEEDLSGRPFVGAAGNLLEKMLLAINLQRTDVYIANIVKCRPPQNRDPEATERLACMPYLVEQIEIIRPKMLLVVGLVAAQTLLGNTNTLQWHRDKVHEFMGIPVYVTYHPAALLRNSNWKRPAWEDLQAFQKDYNKL
jgi:DNA polymerase